MSDVNKPDRAVFKLYLEDLQALSSRGLGEMLEQGAVEVIIDVDEPVSWDEVLGEAFAKLQQSVDDWRDPMRNKTVIVNFVAAAR